MKKYFITKDKNSFHIFYKGLSEIEKEKFKNDLRQNYNVEVSYELLLNSKKDSKK